MTTLLETAKDIVNRQPAHRQPADRQRRSDAIPRWSRGVVLALVPVVVTLVLGVRIATPENGVDDYIYVGVVERLGDYLIRFPDGYFPYRFGYIFPEWIFRRLFGIAGGFLMLRFVLMSLICVVWARRTPANLLGVVVGAVLIFSSPILHRGVFDTYIDSTAVLFLMLGAATMATTQPRSRWSKMELLLGAVALALAWNSNLGVLPLAVVIAATAIIDHFAEIGRSDPWSTVDRMLYIIGGTTLTVVAGVAVYGVKFGVWDIYSASLNQAGGQTNDVFKEQFSNWFTWRHYLLIGPISVVAGIVSWRRTSDLDARRVLRRLTWMAGTSLALFAAFQWILDRPLLSTPYYAVYPLCLCLLLLGRVVQAELHRSADRVPLSLALGVCGLAFVVYRAGPGLHPPYSVVVLVAAAGLVPILVNSPLKPLLVGGLVVSTAFVTISSPHDFPGSSSLFRIDPRYDDMLFAYDWSGLDNLRITGEFARSVPSLPETRGEVRVWFDQSETSHQLLSTLLHYSSALQLPGSTAMPDLSEFVDARLTIDRPRFLLLLADDEATNNTALERLRANGYPYRETARSTFREGDLVAYVIYLEHTDWRDYPCRGNELSSVPCN